MSLIPHSFLLGTDESTGSGSINCGDFPISNSALFTGTEFMTRTFGTPTDNKVWSFSFWLKRTTVSTVVDFPTITFGNTVAQFADIQITVDGGTHPSRLGSRLRLNGITDKAFFATDHHLRDFSGWSHCLVVMDTTQGVQVDRFKFFIDGQQHVYSNLSGAGLALNDTTFFNSALVANLGKSFAGGTSAIGYIADMYLVDGQALTPNDFGEFNSVGKWVPAEYTGTYGNNGFHLKFDNNANLGEDSSGNVNHWTNNGVIQSNDSPTHNLAIMNKLFLGGGLATGLSEGNLRVATSADFQRRPMVSTIGVPSGKYYVEAVVTKVNAVSSMRLGVVGDVTTLGPVDVEALTPSVVVVMNTASGTQSQILVDNVVTQTGLPVIQNNDIFSIKLDMDGKTVEFFLNDSPFGTVETLSNFDIAHIAAATFHIVNSILLRFDENSWTETVPSGFVEMNVCNLPEYTINPKEHFNAVTYTGDGINKSLNFGFQPDLFWAKSRDTGNGFRLYDSVRTATAGDKEIMPFTDAPEGTNGSCGIDFTATGIDFNVGVGITDEPNDVSGANYIGWAWNTNDGSSSTNTDGTITSTVSAGVAQGVSVVKYTSNNIAGSTVGHGLGTKPDLIITKNLEDTRNWGVYHSSLGATDLLFFNLPNAKDTNSIYWDDTEPTNTVFTLGTTAGETNFPANDEFIAYCFTSIHGFSNTGVYTGNGSTDGPFVYTGFKPAFVMIRSAAGFLANWEVFDNKRDPDNPNSANLKPNLAVAEDITLPISVDFVSNGFKCRGVDSEINASGADYVYIAFAKMPF